jgi:ABC-type glycerol-3-phosphate transport system substrate-binding protein
MAKRGMNRRFFLRQVTIGAAGVALAACGATATPQSVSESTGAPAAAPTATTAAVATAAPSTASGGAQSITLWWAIGLTDLIEKDFLPAFATAKPDITVDYLPMSWGDARQKLLPAFAAGNPPDLYTAPDFAQYGISGKAQSLDEFMAGWDGKDDFVPAITGTCTFGGKLTAMPFVQYSNAIVYHKGLFEKAGLDPEKGPDNWDDFLVDAKAGTIRDGDKWTQAGIQLDYTEGAPWIMFLWQNGGELWDDNYTEALFNTDAGVEALTYYCDLFTKHEVAPTADVDVFAPGVDAFTAGRAMMAIGGGEIMVNVKQFFPELYDNVNVSLPLEKKIRATNGGGGWPHCIASQSAPEKQKAAWELLAFFMSTDNQVKVGTAGGMLPSRKAAQPTFLTDPRQAILAEAAESAKNWLRVSKAEALAEVKRIVPRVVFDGMDPKQALDEAATNVNRVFTS